MDIPPAHEDTPARAEFGRGQQLKTTQSLCPQCLERIAATVYERDGEVWMDKACQAHGRFSALLSSAKGHYYRAQAQAPRGGCCGSKRSCGPTPGDNHSCNLLIEITQRCNLTCPTCYADSSPSRHEQMSMPRFEALLEELLARGKGDADLVQLSGGEPTVHPQMLDMVRLARTRGVRRVYINTNGIRLARSELAAELAAIGGVSVYLQLDGLRKGPTLALRGREDLLATKLEALDRCEAAGLDVVPVMTVARGVNEDEVGALVRLAQQRPRSIRKLMFQPAMYSGRHLGPRLVRRLGVADLAKSLAEQVPWLREDDFGPIPCSDPNCFSMALAVRGPKGPIAVSRFFPPYERWAEPEIAPLVAGLSDRFDRAEDLEALLAWTMRSGALSGLDESQLDALLDALAEEHGAVGPAIDDGGYGNLIAIGIKPFMDAYTLDYDRVEQCCVHIVATDGTPVSFCEYNARNRPLGIG